MTDTELRDLFLDAAPSLDRPDPAAIDLAWRDGSRRRVGARAAVVGSIAATAAAVTGVAMLDLGGPSPAPSSQNNQDDSAYPPSMADYTFGQTEMWFSPTPEEELALPTVDPARSPVPDEISLTDDAPSATDEPLRSAVAALAAYGDSPIDRLLLVDPDGERRWLDLTGLTSDGDRIRPVTAQMLAPDGRTLIFPQGDHVMRFDILSGEWQRVDTEAMIGNEVLRWVDATSFAVSAEEFASASRVYSIDGRQVSAVDAGPLPQQPFREGQVPTIEDDLGAGAVMRVPINGDHDPYGAALLSGDVSALSWVGQELSETLNGTTRRATELAIVDGPVRKQGLFFAMGDSDENGRWLQCCRVVGLLDDDTVIYESRKAEPQLIAWTIGRIEFESVTRITGLPAQTSYVASWAFSAD